MKHELQVKILKELFDQIDNNKNVDAGIIYKNPTSSYVDPALAEKEWQTFFQNHPQIIGMSADLPDAGSFFTCNDSGTPVLATRDDNGKFHAFVNACRHRGVLLTDEERGKNRKFVCPFHAWTYKTDGSLFSIPQHEHFGDIDKTCHNLISLPAEERYGLLWVHPQPDGELNVDELLGSLSDELSSLDWSDFVYCDSTTIEKKLNWKLANDTFGETYHFQKLHKQTLGQRFHGDNLSYETLGRNHRFVFSSKTIEFLREKPESEWQLWDGAVVLYYLFPNVQLNVSSTSLALIRIYPDQENPGRSITRVSHYFKQQVLDDLEEVRKTGSMKIYDAENIYDGKPVENYAFSIEAQMEIFNSSIEKEDYAMGEAAQHVADSGTLEYLLFGKNEAPLHHYHNNFRDALGMPPLERVES